MGRDDFTHLKAHSDGWGSPFASPLPEGPGVRAEAEGAGSPEHQQESPARHSAPEGPHHSSSGALSGFH